MSDALSPDLSTTLALAEVVNRLRVEGKSTDDAIAILRGAVNDVIESLRVEHVTEALTKGPADMKLICARALEAGCTLNAGQVSPILDDAISRGTIASKEEPTGRGRPRVIYAFTEGSEP